MERPNSKGTGKGDLSPRRALPISRRGNSRCAWGHPRMVPLPFFSSMRRNREGGRTRNGRLLGGFRLNCIGPTNATRTINKGRRTVFGGHRSPTRRSGRRRELTVHPKALLRVAMPHPHRGGIKSRRRKGHWHGLRSFCLGASIPKKLKVRNIPRSIPRRVRHRRNDQGRRHQRRGRFQACLRTIHPFLGRHSP